MATETERKFLVKGEFRHLAVSEKSITQAYLSVNPDKTIRIRIADQNAWLTIKSSIKGKTFAKNEWEFSIPFNEGMQLMSICLPGKIVKTRYLIPAGEHTFEVDVFHDKNEGLVIAEIELSSEDEKFLKPDWLGEEVTGKPEYYNSSLIK
jgi:adenylate cyclase